MARPRKRPGVKPRVDWKKARRLREQDAKSWVEIAEIVGCHRETVARRARRERWLDPSELRQKNRDAREAEISRRFVERDAETIAANLTAKHDVNRRILALTGKMLGTIEQAAQKVAEDPDKAIELLAGDGGVVLALRRIAMVASAVEVTDSRIARLNDDWRSGSGGSAEDSGADAEAVRSALAELEEDEPEGGR